MLYSKIDAYFKLNQIKLGVHGEKDGLVIENTLGQ